MPFAFLSAARSRVTADRVRLAGVGLAATFAIGVHLRLILAVPDPFFFGDSESYLQPVLRFLFQGPWEMNPERTVGYPGFLLMMLGLFRSFWPLLLVQHVMAIATALAVSLLYYQRLRRSVIEASAVFFFTAILPQSVFWAHAVMTESLFAFVAFPALYAYFSGLERPAPAPWLWTGALLALAFVVRPITEAWVGVLALIAAIRLGPTKNRRYLAFFAGAFVACLAPFYLLNFLTRGYVGLEKLGGQALFSTTAQYLEPARLPDSDVRRILLPIYNDPKRRPMFPNPAWVPYGVDGPGVALRRAYPDPVALDPILRSLARRAILDHPFLFIRDQIAKFFYAFFCESMRPRGTISKERIALEGFAIFGQLTESYPAARRFLRFHPSDQESYRFWMQSHPAFPFEPGPFPLALLWPYAWGVGLLPILALLSGVSLLRGRKLPRLEIVTLWSLIAVHLLLSNLGAGPKSRFAHPLEPIYVMLAAWGISTILRNRNQEDFS